MEDRRRSKRLQLDSKLIIKSVDNAEEVGIDILDVSKSGIGFKAEKLLSIGELYEAFLTIWTKEVIHTFLKIVRIELLESGYAYGAVFIGMPELDASRIEVYQAVSEHEG